MSRGKPILLVFLALSVLASGIGVVYAKYAGRKCFVELQALRADRDAINVEWGRLQLEQSTWATHGRIETMASQKLQMVLPKAEQIVVVRP